MASHLTERLIQLGLPPDEATHLGDAVIENMKKHSAEKCWEIISKENLSPKYKFAIHKFIYQFIYPDCYKLPAPVWFPNKDDIKKTTIAQMMHDLNIKKYEDFHQWSVSEYQTFWQSMIAKLNIVFDKPYQDIIDLSDGLENPHWLPGAMLNIANSCFTASRHQTAIIEKTEQGEVETISYDELDKLSNRVANSLTHKFQLKKGDRIAIIMPMSIKAIAIYLGIIKAGGCVVAIPDSYAAPEIASRLHIISVKHIFVQDTFFLHHKPIHLYEKIIDASAPAAVVVANKEPKELRKQDISWQLFLEEDDQFTTLSCQSEDDIAILFSSGTSAEPKAIPWTHVTPIKCVSDAYLHYNFEPNDIICWPTNLGWMMGPWLMFASFINHATIAIYNGAASERSFGEFVQEMKVTCLGVIPKLVHTWRTSQCMEGLDWNSIKLFGSTGESSSIDDMLYLMSLTSYQRPVIEYCGGTEIAGAYLTGTLLQPCAPAAFTTPALGISFKIIDSDGIETDNGEIAIIPPAIGLSTEVLNQNHHQIYYAGMPTMTGQLYRRHGDKIKKFPNGFYRFVERIDDTMNISGIKISSIEIQHVLKLHPMIAETAAIAADIDPGSPKQLVIYAVPNADSKLNAGEVKKAFQALINKHLNPLFKIHEVILVKSLPRTASNKLMKRVLIEEYAKSLAKPLKEKDVTQKKKICLALQGGGAYGAYTWGILDKFLEDGRLEFEAISATSAGSINAIVMANGLYEGGYQGARAALDDFWRTFSQVCVNMNPMEYFLQFITDTNLNDFMTQASFMNLDLMSRIFSPYFLNPFNFDILRYILEQKINFANLKRNPIKLFLCATNVKTGMLKVFDNAQITVDALLASACLPHLKQAVQMDDEYYWDGGFLGNPAIFPLIYNSQVDDIVIIHNNPIMRDSVPMLSTDIANRANEISFNSSLVRELRAVSFISKLIDKGWIKDEYTELVRRKNVHIIRSDEIMHQFNLANKYNLRWSFISHLRDLGRETASNWLKANFNHLGEKSTIDYIEFLGDDTQTLR